MKYNKLIMNSSKFTIAILITIVVCAGCKKNFEQYNTENTGLTNELLLPDFNSIGAFFPQIQSSVIYNYGNSDWEWQLQEDLIGNIYAGYTMPPTPFRGGDNNMAYSLVDGWNGFPFSLAYNNVMSPINNIKRLEAETKAPVIWGIAMALKVAAMHRVTDTYGPIPYSQFGKGGATVAYDSQKMVYDAMFSDLDIAVKNIKTYIAAYPGATPFKKFDMLFGGDNAKWLKFANSLRLRLAVRIAKIDPVKAKTEAEKAMDPSNGGVLSVNADNANVSGYGIKNPFATVVNDWNDARMNASMESYLTGYSDPRSVKYFEKSSIVAGQAKGIRIGSNILSKDDYLGFSKPISSRESPIQLMTAAEVYFLRAEGALRGWSNMGGSVQELYEKGINTSFDQWGVSGSFLSYINDATSLPINYVDPKSAANNSPALSSITIKWDNAATQEMKLERIITQKWLAIYPEGQEAWSEFRRTGYPKLFPVVVNKSNGTISTSIQIRRINFPSSEVSTNAQEVTKAIGLLGGPDNGGTRLWWDTGLNF